jgi:Family of unknown function (DUF6361)
MSSLTWLDFSDAERKRALQVVELLSRPETRDELGLGAIRDAFAEAMFPGMSTVQRRARYFLFVPWTFHAIERRHAGRTDALDRARRDELRLIEALLDAGDDDGVIGGRARKNLRQVPSMIYWQGLARWGIRRVSGTREQWGRAISRSAGVAADDDGQLVATGPSWWHSGLPEPPEGWPHEASLRLRLVEAEYLRDRIRERCTGTMLATLAERREPWEEVHFPWRLDVPELPARQGELLRHARRFSETMHGAALLYNHALAVGHEDEVRQAEYRQRLTDWVSDEVRADRSLAPLTDSWVLLADIGSRHSPQTRAFVEDWFRLTEDPSRVLRDAGLIERVRERERQVKGRQARLSYDAARETWRGAAGASQLEFRWASTQRQLLDIIGAEDE